MNFLKKLFKALWKKRIYGRWTRLKLDIVQLRRFSKVNGFELPAAGLVWFLQFEAFILSQARWMLYKETEGCWVIRTNIDDQWFSKNSLRKGFPHLLGDSSRLMEFDRLNAWSGCKYGHWNDMKSKNEPTAATTVFASYQWIENSRTVLDMFWNTRRRRQDPWRVVACSKETK